MVNDKDHMHSDKIPNSAPMAYIMKGKSLPTDDLCFIVDDCCKELHTNKRYPFFVKSMMASGRT